MNANGQLIEMLTRSGIFQNYKRAYTASTGVPVTLRPVTTWQLPFHDKGVGNAFCAVMAANSQTCAACLRSQQKLTEAAMDQPATRTCAYGLCETAVPVKLGPQTIGFLQTGHMMRREPTRRRFNMPLIMLRILAWTSVTRRQDGRFSRPRSHREGVSTPPRFCWLSSPTISR